MKNDLSISGCPTCGRTTGTKNVGRDHYGFCADHQYYWYAGTNKNPSWRSESQNDFDVNQAFLEAFKPAPVAPDVTIKIDRETSLPPDGHGFHKGTRIGLFSQGKHWGIQSWEPDSIAVEVKPTMIYTGNEGQGDAVIILVSGHVSVAEAKEFIAIISSALDEYGSDKFALPTIPVALSDESLPF
jgi:hypothetical protein